MIGGQRRQRLDEEVWVKLLVEVFRVRICICILILRLRLRLRLLLLRCRVLAILLRVVCARLRLSVVTLGCCRRIV
eukprot:COSAG06_NODE_1931_length_8044_cov_5.197609_5_plen_76_part_00